jgi:autotransporter strand-loop-strand O-heptosyltransferase
MKINTSFIKGAFCEINEDVQQKKRFQVEFLNKDTNRIETILEIDNHCWAKASKSYFINWKIIVRGLDHNFYYEYDFDCTGKRILIDFDTKLVGDTLAWMPYIERLSIEKQCTVICSTFHNGLFKDQYPLIEFVEPGTTVHNLYAQYTLGFFRDNGNWDIYKHPENPFQQPLQKVVTDILGLPFKEYKPRLAINSKAKKKKQVCIALQGTMKTKNWNNPTGWHEVSDYLIQQGFKVIIVSKEENGYRGLNDPPGTERHPEGSLQDLIKVMEESQFFIGLSSGLSWLAWALDLPTIVVSGFTDSYVEPHSVYRVINRDVCHGCFGTHILPKNSGDDWCPEHKDTDRHFECTTTITSANVIEKIDQILRQNPSIIAS